MALIKCPECGKQISDKSAICIGCGFPISDYIKENSKQELFQKDDGKKYICKSCGTENPIGNDYCEECGIRFTPYTASKKEIAKPIEEFHGVYKNNLLKGFQEVYCPACGSSDCSHYKEQKIVPEKSKTKYSANLNPLRPFTLVNKNEKIIRQEQVYTENKFMCNKCGKIFK